MSEESPSESEQSSSIDASMFSLTVLRFVDYDDGEQLQRFSSLSVDVPNIGEEVQLSEMTIPDSDDDDLSDEERSELYKIQGKYKVEEIQRDYTSVDMEAEDTNFDTPMVEIAVAVSELEESDNSNSQEDND